MPTGNQHDVKFRLSNPCEDAACLEWGGVGGLPKTECVIPAVNVTQRWPTPLSNCDMHDVVLHREDAT